MYYYDKIHFLTVIKVQTPTESHKNSTKEETYMLEHNRRYRSDQAYKMNVKRYKHNKKDIERLEKN